jgi:hypothetical protein
MARFLTILAGLYVALIGLVLAVLAAIGLMSVPEEKFHGAGMMLVIVNLPIIAWLWATAVGIFMKKQWGRISILILSAGTICMGIMMFVSMNVLKDGAVHARNLPSMIMFYGTFLVLIPSFFLLLFNLPSGKAVFLSGPGGTYDQGSGVPLGIKIIAVLYILSITGLSYTFIQPDQHLPLFGDVVLTGLAAKLYMVLMCAICVYIGVGLLKLQSKAWQVFMAYNIIQLVFWVVNMLTLNEENLARWLPPDSGGITLSSYRYLLMFGVLICAVTVFYVYQKKPLFFRVAGGRSK